jgi:hypothetical protein
VLPSAAGLYTIEYDVTAISGSGSTSEVSTADVYCNGANPGAVTNCGLDPRIVPLLERIGQLVELIQRQAVPFAYVEGDVHSGLTGNGELDVQGLIGVLLELTTVPQYVGLEDGTPDVVFDAGWLNWGNADGYSAREQIRSVDFLSLPAVAGQYTKLAYSLTPGVVATITELVREP